MMKIRPLKPFSYNKMYLINQFERDMLDTCMTKLKENDASKKTPVILKSIATEPERSEEDSKKEESKPNKALSNSDGDQSIIEIDENIDKTNVISDSSTLLSKKDDDFHGWKPEKNKENKNKKTMKSALHETWIISHPYKTRMKSKSKASTRTKSNIEKNEKNNKNLKYLPIHTMWEKW